MKPDISLATKSGHFYLLTTRKGRPRLDRKIANERVAPAIDFDCELEEGKW